MSLDLVRRALLIAKIGSAVAPVIIFSNAYATNVLGRSYELFWLEPRRPDAATTRMLPVRSTLHENHPALFSLLDSMAYLLR